MYVKRCSGSSFKLAGNGSAAQARRSHSSMRSRCWISRGVNVRRDSCGGALDAGCCPASSVAASRPPEAR